MTPLAEKPSTTSLSEKAWHAYHARDYPAAAEAFAETAEAYAAAGDRLNSAEMKNNQSVALLKSGKAQAALEAAQGTESVFSASGDFRRQGMALANQASALDALKRKDEAAERYHQAADALEKAGEGDLRADIMQLLSFYYLRRRKFYDALISLQSGLAGVKDPTLRQRFTKQLLFAVRKVLFRRI